ncbi:glycosyltransferase family 2 protein [Emticicia sp. SJ17W-69]|uniref:glycosyltransferase family 2 protein n=1 Tax=Emticicia sp. SJ17W-69 TaxID=3421657 RepID=UPI003EBF2D7E
MQLSIITATYNAELYLQRLIESLKYQKNGIIDFEFIIIDGGSKDNTCDIIKQNGTVVSYWLSEPDKGIYDAWNKGIKKATGDWIMFLGADDLLTEGSIEHYMETINNTSNINEYDLISSRVEMFDTNGKTIRIKGWAYEWPRFLKEMTIAHPGALHSKRLFEKYGLYDTNYKIVGDYELLLRGGKNLKTLFVDYVTVKMSEGGVSDSVKAVWEHYRAVVNTAKASPMKARINAYIVIAKFKIKKELRKLGLNVYLKKSN